MDPRIRALIGAMLTNLSAKDQQVVINLDTGDRVEIAMEGGPGVDSNWYQWLVVKVNEEVVHRG